MNYRNPTNHTLRYLGIVALFCLVCVIYLGRLFFIQISGRENEYKTDITERVVTVQAVRGEIYDRNGVKLVANQYSYDLSIAHAQFYSLSLQERNTVCLDVQNALAKRGGEGVREQKFFPFDGTYPNYTYSADTLNGDSIRAYRLKRVLGDIGLKTDATAKQMPPQKICATITPIHTIFCSWITVVHVAIQTKKLTPSFVCTTIWMPCVSALRENTFCVKVLICP